MTKLLVVALALGTTAANLAFEKVMTSEDGLLGAIASSPDGSQVLASDGRMWRSTDSAKSFTKVMALDFQGNWATIAMSGNGKKVYAGQYGTGHIWRSTDSTKTWSSIDSKGMTSQTWFQIACSKDGSVVAAVEANALWVSTDSGNTFKATTDSPGYKSVAMSDDGTQIWAGGYDGNMWDGKPGSLWRSKDSGFTFDKVTSIDIGGTSQTGVIACSSKGNKIVVGDAESIWLSKNNGKSWTKSKSEGSAFWRSLAMSANGNTIAASNQNGFWTSPDMGKNWIEQDKMLTPLPVNGGDGLTVSADGSTIMTLVRNSIYRSTGRMCHDSKSFHLKGDDSKDCDWVARSSKKRCDQDAQKECPLACGTCKKSKKSKKKSSLAARLADGGAEDSVAVRVPTLVAVCVLAGVALGGLATLLAPKLEKPAEVEPLLAAKA